MLRSLSRERRRVRRLWILLAVAVCWILYVMVPDLPVRLRVADDCVCLEVDGRSGSV